MASVGSAASGARVELVVERAKAGKEIDLTRYALGQGGLSDKPMFDAHVEAVAQLHPQTIRIFVQEFFDLYPEHGRFHWESLDRVIETVRATKGSPILCLCFKPRVLFPKIDQRIVHPSDYAEWEELIFQLVKHCNQEKRFNIRYWEIANEPDIGEDGGCPYLFQAPDYVTYYQHTARAIRRADSQARVGGPALAGYKSDIGTVLIEHCGSGETPLDFFSWHIYNNDPAYFAKTIREVKAKLRKFPRLKATETIIDEWNMSLDHPMLDAGFQPAFVLETTFGFLEEGLSRSAYYHIRDSFVKEEQFNGFMSAQGVSFMARWWNEMPQYDGLYDNQGQVRPAYYAFKLLSLVKGIRVPVSGTTAQVKALAAAAGPRLEMLVWNFGSSAEGETQDLEVRFAGKQNGRFRLTRLNAGRNVNQLEVEGWGDLGTGRGIALRLQRYQIDWISVEAGE